MFSKTLIALCFLIAAVSAVPPGWGFGAGAAANPWAQAAAPWGQAAASGNPFVPPWIATAPWYPQWTPCTTIGSDCLDCTTKVVCTKIGGIQRACTDPTLPYCNLGECSATPSAECAPAAPQATAGAA